MLLLFSCSVVSDSLQPHGLQHARLPCPSPYSRVYSNSCPLVMTSNHLIFCHPFLLLLSIFPIIRVFSHESALHMRLPKYWSFSISLPNEYSGLISFRMDWFDLLAVQGISRVFSILQHHSSKASILWPLSLLYGPTLISIHDYWKNYSCDYTDLCWQTNVSVF